MRRKKTSFDEILNSLRRNNVATLEQRAFSANRIAKITKGRSRRAAYMVKDRSISRVVALGEAEVLRLYGRPIGVQFHSGGQLHLRLNTVAYHDKFPSPDNPGPDAKCYSSWRQ